MNHNFKKIILMNNEWIDVHIIYYKEDPEAQIIFK